LLGTAKLRLCELPAGADHSRRPLPVAPASGLAGRSPLARVRPRPRAAPAPERGRRGDGLPRAAYRRAVLDGASGRAAWRSRRVLSTSALAATFPFSGTDLPAGAGLLYGINTQTRSPVVLDRFALENHNAVVFATSGAGKSYLVKVELARALLAGHRALVIDP